MTYRKIMVDGKQFEYVVGKSHTKVKGLALFKNEDIGQMIVIPQFCECCGEHMSAIRNNWEDPQKLGVTPKNISQAITNFLNTK